MKRIVEKAAMRQWTRDHRAAGRRVGFVPTMGSLHDGHISLVHEARARADLVVTSIYVNPTQFDQAEDLDKYPRQLEADAAKLVAAGCDALFIPRNLYAEGGPPHETWVDVERLTDKLCGAHRPGHFRGVTTVVTKFFNIVEPDVAVFGNKDYQQRSVIQRMVRDLDIPVEIVGAPLIRDHDGIALSSRNARLAPDDRQRALAISRSLFAARDANAAGERDAATLIADVTAGISAAGGRVDYVELVDDLTLEPVTRIAGPAVLAVAAFFGAVRLVDNVALS